VSEPDGLFAEPPRQYAAAGEPVPERTASERMRDRQAANIAAGRHPLSDPPGARPQYGILRLHPDACRDVRWSAAKAQIPAGAPTCGACRFRQSVHGGAKDYPKCTWGRVYAGSLSKEGPREMHGERSDVRAWWPACTDYEEAT
jgi:hypothetical protein